MHIDFVMCNNKPGPAQVGAISKAQNSKKTSKCQVFFYSSRKTKIFRIFFLKKLHTKKMDRVARWGWRANVSQCRKTERGDPLRFFNIHSVAKHQKNAGGPFEEKNSKKKSE